MKPFALTAMTLLTACVEPVAEAPAEISAAEPIAQWGEDSGSLPPEYAWTYTVTFGVDHTVTARYCKGYKSTPPGCATAAALLTEEQFAALQAELTPLAANMAAHKPRETDDIPIGGGVSFATLYQDGVKLDLPDFPREADAPRVAAAIALLKNATPAGLVDIAKSRAR